MFGRSRVESAWLLAAGICSVAVAILHVVVIVVGAPAYRYFGAGEQLAGMAEQGSPIPALVTAGIVVLFAVFGWYGFAGAGLGARPPGLRWVLVSVSGISLLRGLPVVPQVAVLAAHPSPVAQREVVFSSAALLLGLLYATGTWRRRSWLREVPTVARDKTSRIQADGVCRR